MKKLMKASNQVAFLKAGLLGFPGGGKTFSACQIAIGLALKSEKKAVAFFDSEGGSDHLIEHFNREQIELYVARSQKFIDLLDVCLEAEAHCSVLIVDSISHVWRDLCESYRKAKNISKLQFQHWGAIKNEWSRWTQFFLNSRLHIIVCGRAGFEYDFEVQEDGSKDLIKTGIRMKTESEFGFEPSLLLEMERLPRKEGKGWDHQALVLKDRTNTINGQSFRFRGEGKPYKKGDYSATFSTIEPVLAKLNIGADHAGVGSGDSASMFASSDTSRAEAYKQRDIALEEIEASLTLLWPRTDAESKRQKVAVLEKLWGTKSWKAMGELPLETLRNGLATLTEYSKSLAPDVDANVENISIGGSC